jgi:hypothetical protein
MYIPRNDGTGGYGTRGEGWQNDDPNLDGLRRQVDLVFGAGRTDPATEHPIARIAVTTSVMIFLVLVIALALIAPL